MSVNILDRYDQRFQRDFPLKHLPHPNIKHLPIAGVFTSEYVAVEEIEGKHRVDLELGADAVCMGLINLRKLIIPSVSCAD